MRHEKIILVALSYVIGFTTAYIAFGITPDITHKAYRTGEVVKANSVRTTAPSNTAEPSDTPSSTRIVFKDDGMFVQTPEGEKVVSAKLRPNVLEGPGFHVAIPQYAVSPDGEYVYYCEQQTPETDECHNYLYVVDEHTVRPLSLNGSRLTSSVIQSEFSWQPDGTARYNGYTSRSPQQPWELVENN